MIKHTREPIYPSQLVICLFLIFLFNLGLTFGTVRGYLFSLASEIKTRGGRDFLLPFDSWFIRATLKHYRRKLGNAPIRYKRPLTVDILYKLINNLDLSDYNTRVYATMAVIGVYGLLRIGELCCSVVNGSEKYIRNKDVSCEGGVAIIKLYGTKTDFDKKGITKYFSNLKGFFPNPFKMIFILKSIKCGSVKDSDPFFVTKDGKAITRSMFVKFLQTSLKDLFPNINIKEWTGISLRKGGATSAMRAGISGEVIQKLGGWSTDVYKGYLDHSLIDVSMAQQKLAATMLGL